MPPPGPSSSIGSGNAPLGDRHSGCSRLQAVLAYLARMPSAPAPLPCWLLSIELAAFIPPISILGARLRILQPLNQLRRMGRRLQSE